MTEPASKPSVHRVFLHQIDRSHSAVTLAGEAGYLVPFSMTPEADAVAALAARGCTGKVVFLSPSARQLFTREINP